MFFECLCVIAYFCFQSIFCSWMIIVLLELSFYLYSDWKDICMNNSRIQPWYCMWLADAMVLFPINSLTPLYNGIPQSYCQWNNMKCTFLHTFFSPLLIPIVIQKWHDRKHLHWDFGYDKAMQSCQPLHFSHSLLCLNGLY